MSAEQQQLESAIGALDAQRAILGDAVVDAALGPMRARLSALLAAKAPAESRQTLKQVTILFLDLVGSTSLTQRLDPESASAILDDALARGTAVVQTHGGKVLQYAGDSILAAFGADEAREDDTERAVRCGLALLALGKEPDAASPDLDPRPRFEVRVGIHTGGVLLGGGVDADGTIRGIAVSIAARMEQNAPVGHLRVSHDTYAQVRGMFEVEPQEPLTVKGVDEPIQSYLVIRAKPRSFRIGSRGIEGVATRMIGRDAELEAVQEAFKRLFVDRKLAAVTIVADEGIGKTRLLYEFETWSEARAETFYVFRGRATPQTRGQPFGLLRDIVAWRFQITDDDTTETARAKLEQGIVPLFEPDEGPELAESHAHLLGHLIGIEWRDSRHLRGILDDPRQIRNRAFHTAAQVVRRISARDGSPVVLQLEDLHWADNESLDFLNYLAEVDRDVPVLILSLTRPVLFERRSDWSSTQGIHERIDLAPLDKRASRDLSNELLKKLPEVPAALRELITSSSEGNPFYMEELVKMLIDQGAIQTWSETGGEWKVNAERLLVTHVPPTLTGVLQARLDGLPPREKRVLQAASVIGSIFWDQALIELDAQAEDALPLLVSRELALPRADAQVDGLREYAFRHHLLHQVTYDTVLRRTRRELHAKVAQWLSGRTGARASDFLGATAEHYDRAGDSALAAEFHARAAEHALERFGHDAVLFHVDKALSLLSGHADALLQWRLLDAREQTLGLQARRDEQLADIEALERLAQVLDDDGRRAKAALRRCGRANLMAAWPEQEKMARQAMTWAARAGDDRVRLNSLRLLALAHAMQGKLESGKALARQGLAEAASLGSLGSQSRLLNILSIIAHLEGRVTESLDLDRQCLEIDRQTGDRRRQAVALSNLGVSWTYLGNLTQAQRDLEAGLKMYRSFGDRLGEGVALGNLSTVALWQGDDTRALALARSSLDIATAARALDREVEALLALGDAELALGRHAAARQAFLRARERAQEIDSPYRHRAASYLARVSLAQGDPAQALHELQPLLSHVDGGGTFEGTVTPLHIQLTCYLVLDRNGDPRSAEWLVRAHEALQRDASTIPDSVVRQGFLRNIPHHREIVALSAGRGADGEPGGVAVR